MSLTIGSLFSGIGGLELGALGNAVVPGVAEVIGRAIYEAEHA